METILIGHASLKTLKETNALVAGSYYKVVDYKTIHRIAGTTEIHIGPVEPLIIGANATNALSIFATSELYPKDIIIYDINNTLCEDGTTPRNGFITYRKDTVLNNEVNGFDFRNVVFRRFKLLVQPFSSATATTGYSMGSIVSSGANWYVSCKKGLNTSASIGAGGWAQMLAFDTVNVYCHATPFKYANANQTAQLSTDPADFKDYFLFNANNHDASNGSYDEFKGVNNTLIGASVNTNIVITSTIDGNNIYQNTFKQSCTNMTFWKSNFARNAFGVSCNNVFNYNSFYNNNIQESFNNHWCCDGFAHNDIGNGYSSSYHGFIFANNKVAGACGNFILANKATGNDFNTVIDTLVGGGLFCGNKFTGGYISLNSYPYGTNYMNNIYIGDSASGNVFTAKDTKEVYMGNGCINNTFNAKIDTFGTVAAPVVITGCVVNAPLTNVTTSGTLTNVVINTPIASKTLPAITGVVINDKSPDGSIWASGISNAGAPTPTKIV